MAPEPLPERIGPYRILGRLGAGGMGEVFLAEDTKLERRVAIKRPKLDTTADDTARRLLTEARAVARLDHPNICGIYEVGEDESGPFIVMPVVEGETLSTVLAKGPLPFPEAADLSAQIADALAAAHEAGILHRDIKPGNIIVNARKQARVMDFGLAKLQAPTDVPGMAPTVSFATAAGTTLGTIAYMSPEQARGERTDARSDLFSLGTVLYESIAGRHPFAGPSVAETLTSVQTQDPPPLARFRPDAPDLLQRIVSKLLRKAPEERYQSAADVAVDLKTAARELRGDTAATVLRAPSTAIKAQPWRGALIAGLVLAAAAVAGFFLWRSPSQNATPPATLQSLAVLPFLNRAGDAAADNDYIVDGITESVIRKLAGLHDLKVISRNTVFRFRNQNENARRIASDLGVAAVMTGTVSRMGNQVAIDVELSNVADDSVLFSQRYLEDATNIMKFEAAIARDVAERMRLSLTSEDHQRMGKGATASNDAYQRYLRGRFYESQLTPASLHQAIDQYQAAVKVDPSYAQAHAEMAGVYLLLGIYFEAPQEAMTAARTHATQALSLDPMLRDPHVVLGMVHLLFDWNYPAAAKEMMASGRLQPESLGILGCTAHLLEATGQLSDAEREIKRAIESDPLSIGLKTELGCGAYYRRQYDEAIRGYNDALKLEPRNDVAYWGLGRAFGQKQMYAEALGALGKSDRVNGVQAPIILSEIGYVYGRSGKASDARRVISEMIAPTFPGFVDPYLVAVVYAGMGENDAAFQWLDKACSVRSPFLPSLPEDPKWDPLKADPRFKDLTKRVGFL